MNNLNKILSRVFGIIRRTGDKFVVLDELGESFVVMPLHDYEKIVEGKSEFRSMSEQELLDSVERDIALWRAEHEDYEDYNDIEPPMSFDPAQDFQSEPWEMESFGKAQDRREPWERESWEKEPLLWEDESDQLSRLRPHLRQGYGGQEGYGGRAGISDSSSAKATADRQEDDEIEDLEFGDFNKEDKLEKSDLDATRRLQSETWSQHGETEPIKYEDIPPPPDVNIDDIMGDESFDRAQDLRKDKEEIIDMSFEDEEDSLAGEESEDDEFMEESVF